MIGLTTRRHKAVLQLEQLEVISREPSTEPFAIPLLFVHGPWHGAWCWDEHMLPYFANLGYSVHALSLRGHGKSSGHPGVRWACIEDYVIDVVHVASQLPRPPVLIGHSMGCWIIQKYFEYYPAAGAVLLAPVPPGGPISFLLDIAQQYPWEFVQMGLAGRLQSSELAQFVLFSADMPRQQIESYYAQLGAESSIAILEMIFARVYLRKPAPVPILVLGAVDDAVFSLQEVQATADLYRTRAEFFPYMAHDMMLERDWLRVANRIVGWLQEYKLQ